MTTFYSNIDKPAYHADSRQHVFLGVNRTAQRVIWQAQVRAAFLADWFLYKKGSRADLVAQVNAAAGGQPLPRTGDILWTCWLVPQSYSNLNGEVFQIRVTWQISEVPA